MEEGKEKDGSAQGAGASRLGKDLRVGDTIEVGWAQKRDTITKLTPYDGNLAHLWEDEGGARIAEFALGLSMTIEPTAQFNVLDTARGSK